MIKENPTLRKVGLDTASGWNDKPNVSQAPDIYKQIDTTLSRINKKIDLVISDAERLARLMRVGGAV